MGYHRCQATGKVNLAQGSLYIMFGRQYTDGADDSPGPASPDEEDGMPGVLNWDSRKKLWYVPSPLWKTLTQVASPSPLR